jgi:hypothetical protein
MRQRRKLSESPADQQKSFSCFDAVDAIKRQAPDSIDRAARCIDDLGPLGSPFMSCKTASG